MDCFLVWLVVYDCWFGWWVFAVRLDMVPSGCLGCGWLICDLAWYCATGGFGGIVFWLSGFVVNSAALVTYSCWYIIWWWSSWFVIIIDLDLLHVTGILFSCGLVELLFRLFGVSGASVFWVGLRVVWLDVDLPVGG